MPRRGGDDERPAVELWGAEPEPIPTQRVEIGVRRSNRLPVVLAVVAVAGLLGAGLVLGDSDGADGASDPTSAAAAREEQDDKRDEQADGAADGTTTSRPRRPTTTTAPTTTLPPGPVLWERTGVALLATTSGARWTWVDLDTGERREIELEAYDPWFVIPARGGVVHLDRRSEHALFQPLPDGEPLVLGPASEVLATEDPAAVWLLRRSSDDGTPLVSPRAQLVRIDGTLLGDEISVASGYPRAATTQGVIFGGGGRAFQQDDRGVRSLGIGDVLNVRGTSVALATCDDAAVCRPEVLDLVTGARTVFPALPTADPYNSVVEVTPDGGLLVSAFPPDGFGDVEAVLYDGAGQERGRVFLPNVPNTGTAWLPGSSTGLLPADGGVVRLHEVDGQLVTTPVPGLDGLRAEWALVIPR